MATTLFSSVYLKRSIILLFCIITGNIVFGQCPANIDFEDGTFVGWKLYIGDVSVSNGQNNILLEEVPDPIPNRHQLIYGVAGTDNIVPRDYYGGFSEASPNGSAFSVKLGNDQVHSEAEGISYDFDIPATAHQFSITYWYAVVFQDPGHLPEEQPRMDIEVTNLTDNVSAGCSSFAFIANSSLPGFFISPKRATSDTTAPVWCRDWTANTINLDGNEGKSFRIFFKTADCTKQGHFGYAYIDVSSNCSSSFYGASYCPGDTSIDLHAPGGYQSYKWFSNGFSQVLGTTQTLHLAPPPPAGSNVLVQVTPYPGYGCSDTLTATLEDTLHVTASAGGNTTSCDTSGVQLGGVSPDPSLSYSWTPTTGLSNPNISNPIAHINATITYTLKVSSVGGGCVDYDQATVYKPSISDVITLTGNSNYCAGTLPASVLHVNIADSIQWYKDDVAIPGATQTAYTATETGNYYATVFSFVGTGCQKNTAVKKITIYPAPHASFSINNTAQCSPLDTFILKNLSAISSGTIQYQWFLGDGVISSEDSVTHIYSAPGNYSIRLHASADGGCISDTTIAVLVKPGVAPQFSAKNICTNLQLPLINNSSAPGANTVNYLWEFGNGDVDVVKDPVYHYPAPGNYTIRLSASTPECPDEKIITQDIVVTAPEPAMRYPDHPAIINYPEPVEARHIGITALWRPVLYLNNAHVYKPFFRSFVDQEYNITLTTNVGCVTVDTVLVKVYKQIKINVPTAFTPNGDGINDLLKPLLYGFKKVNYFRVYDRWGKILFEAHDDLHGWDGTFKGMPLDVQTIIWVINAEDVDGVMHSEKGVTTILR